jgi:hypothetical protein
VVGILTVAGEAVRVHIPGGEFYSRLRNPSVALEDALLPASRRSDSVCT